MKLIHRLLRDEAGSVLSAELVMLVTLLGLGIVVAAKSLRDSAVSEFADFAQAIANLDQSYNVPDSGPLTPDGSGFEDLRDFCDDDAAPQTSTNTKFTTVVCSGTPTDFAVDATSE